MIFELVLGEELVFQFEEVEVVGGVDGEVYFIIDKGWIFEFYYFLTRYLVLAMLQFNYLNLGWQGNMYSSTCKMFDNNFKDNISDWILFFGGLV